MKKLVISLAIALAACGNLYELMRIQYSMEGWTVVGGLVGKDDYLSRMHASYPTPPYEGILWMNQHLPADAKVLFAGEGRNYYMQRVAVPSSVHDPEPIIRWSHEASSAAAFREKLKAEGISYIYLNLVEAMRNSGYKAFHWNPAQWKIFDEFWNRDVELTWKTESMDRQNPKAQYVYRVLSDDEASRPHVAPPNPFQRWIVDQ